MASGAREVFPAQLHPVFTEGVIFRTVVLSWLPRLSPSGAGAGCGGTMVLLQPKSWRSQEWLECGGPFPWQRRKMKRGELPAILRAINQSRNGPDRARTVIASFVAHSCSLRLGKAPGSDKEHPI